MNFFLGPDARVASLVPFTLSVVRFCLEWGSAVLLSGQCPHSHRAEGAQ